MECDCKERFYQKAAFITHHVDMHNCSSCSSHQSQNCRKRLNIGLCPGCICAESAHIVPSDFGCGFCGALYHSWGERCKHVFKCRTDTETLSKWDYSLEIDALIFKRDKLLKEFGKFLENSHRCQWWEIVLIWKRSTRTEKLREDLQCWDERKNMSGLVKNAHELSEKKGCTCNMHHISLRELHRTATLNDLPPIEPYAISHSDNDTPGFNQFIDESHH